MLRNHGVLCACGFAHLLLLLLPGDVAPLDLPVTEEVAEVAEDGEDAVAHVGEHRHQHGRLLERLDEGPAVQAAVTWRRMDLGNTGKTENLLHWIITIEITHKN